MKTTPKRVLVIDDDPFVGKMTLAHLKSGGHEGRLTDDAEEFMRLCGTWHPDFAIVDLVMEGVDGLEVLRRIADCGCGIGVIIASGQEGRVLDAAHRFADASGITFVGVLSKPYRRSQLLDLLAQRPSTTEIPVVPDPSLPWGELEFEESFRDGLTSGAVTVVFQPKVDCSDGRVVGYEALARWVHPERGDITPTVFVPLAEKRGLVSLLTDRVMREALDWFGRHPHREGRRLSVNVSSAEFSDPEIDERLLKACQEAAVPTSQVIIELTETSAMDDPVLSLQLLTRLRLQGFEISLDDFGTGYSSMLQLARLPFSEIKVDQSFVSNAATSDESVIVIRSIVDLGHALGLKCTAEGVEDAKVLSLLEKFGCDFAQGFHIGHPMVPDDLDEWLKTAKV
ncbi:MAG: EAL domain-containing response regulator [Demequinaceae bacterium]|nr:EAL domain-containing response regulator [Demequinaceae bacterium]